MEGWSAWDGEVFSFDGEWAEIEKVIAKMERELKDRL